MADKLIFGHVPGVLVGATFGSYAEMNSAAVHRSTMGGISGQEKIGAGSIVISGGYEDDIDQGDVIVYTGQGGRNASGKHTKDQELRRGNLALAVNQREGLPLRVIRGQDSDNVFAPATGYRYDGLYRVDSHWHEVGKSGFKIWRYRLEKLDVEHVPTRSGTMNVLVGGNPTPARRTSIVQRIVRDTKQAKEVKRHYEHFCQVCATRILTASGPYAEAAHIRPLGEPHNGPDTQDNLLCLCPNHHVMFDMGVFSIQDDLSLIGIEGKLHLKNGHFVSQEYLQYHREHYLDHTN